MAEEDTSFKIFFNAKDGEEEHTRFTLRGGNEVCEARQGGQSGVTGVRRLPTKLDWKNCRLFVQFLKLFYDATKRFSASLFVTSNCFFDEVYSIETFITHLITSKDPLMCNMAKRMKIKFDKYWGEPEDEEEDVINPLLYVAVALDPQLKLRWVKFAVTESKGKVAGERMEKNVTGIFEEVV
ncbi:hypothetical protein RHMOL_Rhmol10G0050700 [Rhododendron molle]|uniref:Uncharacterized protein n=1 Tax=Rhododendron molle TaxID=49168 RepID=A0ACC0M073_RHOML|nr:hypothetical protein RHMOL_Rhmol10G0050700 [Rhododendron molle]